MASKRVSGILAVMVLCVVLGAMLVAVDFVIDKDVLAEATGVPGSPSLSMSPWGTSTDGNYTIKMDMWWGNNGTQWKLYEQKDSGSFQLVWTQSLQDNSPNPQSVSKSFVGKPNGTYTYKCELINSYGITSSSTISIKVQKPEETPIATPTLSPTPSPTPVATPTLTPTPSLTPTLTPTWSPTPTATPSSTPTPTLSPTPSVTPTPTLTPTPNLSIEITHPEAGQVFVKGIAVEFKVQVASEYEVAKVEFFEQGTKVGEDTQAPYSITYTPKFYQQNQLESINYLSARITDVFGMSKDTDTYMPIIIQDVFTPTPTPSPTPTLTPFESVTPTVTPTATPVQSQTPNVPPQVPAEVTLRIQDKLGEQAVSMESSIFSQLRQNYSQITIRNGKISITVPSYGLDSAVLQESQSYKKVEFNMVTQNLQSNVGLFADVSEAIGNILFPIDANVYQPSYRIVLDDHGNTQMVQRFTNPATVVFYLDHIDLSGTDIGKLGIYYYNEEQKKWDYVGGEYDSEINGIRVKTQTLGTFMMMRYNQTFDDIANHWAKEDIEYMSAQHIVKGKTQNQFAPNAEITRAEFTAILVRAMGLQDNDEGQLPFHDVKQSDWYYQAVANALKVGIASGTSEVAFSPQAKITREQMATMIIRALYVKKQYVSMDYTQVVGILQRFEDRGQIAEYAKQNVAIAVQYGIVNGRTTTTFDPKSNTTRAEAVVMIKRFLDNV